MASPQKENGYTSIANEIMEKLSSYRISGEEWQVLCVILRQTYGWQKKEDHISLTQFSAKTGLNRKNVWRALNKLSSKKMIVIIKNTTSYINIYRFNKDFDTWQPVIKKATPIPKSATTPSPIKPPELSPKVPPTKQQTNNTKQIAQPPVANPLHKEIIEVIEAFGVVNPSYETLFRNKTQRASAERLIKQHGLEKVKKWIENIKITNKIAYAPIVTTPLDLENKLGSLLAFVEKRR